MNTSICRYIEYILKGVSHCFELFIYLRIIRIENIRIEYCLDALWEITFEYSKRSILIRRLFKIQHVEFLCLFE